MARPRLVPSTDPTARLVGHAPAIEALRVQIRHLAAFDTIGNPEAPTLLLQGEIGTGKGLVARVIHDSGPRAHDAFIEANCAAIPKTLLEAELFGFEAGTFTDAKRAKPGLFEAASGGSLFLDEIDALPLGLQGKFLKAIEEKRVRRLGAVAEHAVDVKLIAATQVELSEHIRGGRFRADLYHRLAVVVLELPPLRERGDDILVLARAFLQRYAAAHKVASKRLSQAAEAWLLRYSWPGNVRELSQLMERVMLLSPETLLAPETLERLCTPHPPSSPASEPKAGPAGGEPVEIEEPSRIREALLRTGGNVQRAAHLLGLSRNALRYRMSRYGIERQHGEDVAAPSRIRRPAAPLRPQDDRGYLPPPVHTAETLGWEQKPVVILAIEFIFPRVTDTDPARFEPWTLSRRWEQAIIEKVQGFGGILVQRSPSLLLMAFGLPQAVEQLPQRAVQAALAIRHLTEDPKLLEGRQPYPEVRQAAHLGAALVEDQTGEAVARLLAVGDTLALPVRLLGRAGPADIVLSPALGRLVVGWCELQALPPLAASEHPPQVNAYRVGGLVPRRSPLAGLGAQALSPFAGRERELAVLHALLAQAEEGHGQAVGVVGEPGAGKSRLLYEFRQRLAGARVTYLEGRCLAYDSAAPYLPVLDLLRHNCGITEADTPTQITAKVQVALQEVGMAPDEYAPYLLRLLGLSAGTGQLAEVSPETLRRRTVETLRQLSLYGSQRRPLILAVEDLQWADPSSEAFFTSLVECLAGAPMLFMATYRPGYRPPWLGQSYATQLALPPLAPQESRSMVRTLCQAMPLPEPLVQSILTRSEGNPLFLEELTRAVLEQGDVRGEVTLPDTLQEVLLARIDRLPAAARRALQLASMLRREFSLSLMQALWEGSKLSAFSPEDGTEPQQALARLVEAELLYQRGVPPQAVYRFKHALIQEAAYQALLQSQRQQYHRRIAQVLEERFPETAETQPEVLAYHYTAAGLHECAVLYWRRAGERALEHSANVEAVSYLTKGLEGLKTLPKTREHLAQELTLIIALGPPLMAMNGYAAPEVERVYTRAHELYQQVGEPPQLFQVLWGLWLLYHSGLRATLQTAYELGEQLLTLAQRLEDPAFLVEAHRALGTTLFLLGEFASARAHLEQGVALYDPQRHHSLAFVYGRDPRVTCLSYGAQALWFLGYPEQALQRSQDTLTLARELSHPLSLAHALFFAARVRHYRREAQAAQKLAEAQMALASEQGFAQLLAQAMILRGWALAEQGHEAEGLAEMRQALEIARRQQAKALELRTAMSLSRLWRQQGQGPKARQLLAEIYGWFTEGSDTADLQEARALLEELS
jgi:DNA-binding NtrC family response regulator/predicted ATPase